MPFKKGHKINMGKKHTEEHNKRISESSKGKNCWTKSMFGKDASNWKGGISRDYGRKQIKKIFCGDCGKTETKLIIHHIDCNPKNNEINNLKVLCHRCHKLEHSRLKREVI